MAIGRTANANRIALLLWALLAFFYFYLSYDYIRVTSHDQQFADYMHSIVQLAGNQGRQPNDVRGLLLAKAAALSLPVRRDQIQIRGTGMTLDIAVNYDVDIQIPVLKRQVLTKNFQHTVRYQFPR